MAGNDVKLPIWFWGICSAIGIALVGAYISWMGWTSLQLMATSGDTREVKAQLADIKATQARQEAVTQNLQQTVQDLATQVAKSESRLDDQREEIRNLREKLYGAKQ